MKRWIAFFLSLLVSFPFFYIFAKLNFGAGVVVGFVLGIFLYTFFVHGERPGE